MATAELRRSARLNTQDSNGRDHLAALMPGWTRAKLEGWIISPTVRPHLQFWYQLCVASRGRFNGVVDWINTGEARYFYNPRHLEEDLLLMCLCEGSPKTHEEGDQEEERVLAKAETDTAAWFTQELWARTAWRIVHANCGPGQAFEHMVQEVPAGTYGFVIEILCIAFHSIAFRGRASCYERLINGPASEKKMMYTTLGKQAEKLEDTEIDASEELSDASTETSDHSSDLDFEESRRCISVRRVKLLEPRLKYDKNSSGAQIVRKWISGLHADELFNPSESLSVRKLRLVDEVVEEEQLSRDRAGAGEEQREKLRQAIMAAAQAL